MAAERSYARLGLFVVLSLVVVLATALLFIERQRRRPVIGMVTFTTENVSGLDVSSPVRLKGVPVGRVEALHVDPASGAIRIDFQLFVDRLVTLGANVERTQAAVGLEAFRAQVVRNPVTGEAYLFLDAPANPPPTLQLGFTPDRPYVPSMPTPLATMQDRLPEVLERVETTLRTLRDIIAKIPDSMERSDRFFTNVERIVRESQLPELSADSRKFFAMTSTQMGQIATDLDGLVGAGGTLTALVAETRESVRAADMPGATKSAREALESTSLAADDLRRTLPVIRDSLQQLQEVARQFDEQPESAVYGPRPTKRKPE
jgi:ABC-type transporter Mla subunit MlaD